LATGFDHDVIEPLRPAVDGYVLNMRVLRDPAGYLSTEAAIAAGVCRDKPAFGHSRCAGGATPGE
jgi:hypothetical protein